MARLVELLAFARSMIDKGIYCWDLNGVRLDELTEKMVREKETSKENADKVLKLLAKRKDRYPYAIAADCSGFVVWCLVSCGAKQKGFDKSAEGFRKECKEINVKELRDGDLCFKMGTRDGVYKAVHVGIYDGGKVIEDRGRAYGIVSRSRLVGGWDKYGRLGIKWEDEPKGFVLTRLLKKGCKGSDVKALQELLAKLGYTSVGKADSIFGSKTKTAVQELQRTSGLKADGIVGPDTCKILGWTYKKS